MSCTFRWCDYVALSDGRCSLHPRSADPGRRASPGSTVGQLCTCGGPVRAKGLCHTCYMRAYRRSRAKAYR